MGFWSFLAKPGVQLLGQLAGSVAGNLFNRSGQKKMWSMANDYNHPVNQMARLKQAGLNPNLVYGSGSVTHQATTPQLPKQESLAPDFMGAFVQFQQLKNLQIQEERLREETEYLRKRITGTELDNTLKFKGMGHTLEGLSLRNTEAQERIVKARIYNSQLPDLLKSQIAERLSRMDVNEANITWTKVKTAIDHEILKLRKQGLNPNDPYWMKKLGEFIETFIEKSQTSGAFKNSPYQFIPLPFGGSLPLKKR